jgi:hypothetical protein
MVKAGEIALLFLCRNGVQFFHAWGQVGTQDIKCFRTYVPFVVWINKANFFMDDPMPTFPTVPYFMLE